MPGLTGHDRQSSVLSPKRNHEECYQAPFDRSRRWNSTAFGPQSSRQDAGGRLASNGPESSSSQHSGLFRTSTHYLNESRSNKSRVVFPACQRQELSHAGDRFGRRSPDLAAYHDKVQRSLRCCFLSGRPTSFSPDSLRSRFSRSAPSSNQAERKALRFTRRSKMSKRL